MIPSVTYKLPPRLILTATANQTFARLPEGHFIARIYTSNVGYAFSPTLSFSNLMQYDNRSRNLGWQTRVRWTLQPGNDLFFAFNQGWIQEDEDFATTGRIDRRFRAQDTKLSAKIQYRCASSVPNQKFAEIFRAGHPASRRCSSLTYPR